MILALLLAQDLQLEYKYEKGRTFESRSDATVTLAIDGTDSAVTFLMTASEFFSFQKIHVVSEAATTVRRVDDDGKATIRSKPTSARFDGLYDDAPFEHAFEYPGSAPEDPLAAALWAMGSEISNSTMDRLGAARHLKQEDATAEALFFAGNLAPRLPSDGRVTVGREWTERWPGEREDDEGRGTYAFHQTCRVERVEGSVAVISVKVGGELKLKPEVAKRFAETKTTAGQTCESAGTAWFDREAGRVIKSEFDGRVHAFFDGPDQDNAARHKFEITITLKGTAEER